LSTRLFGRTTKEKKLVSMDTAEQRNYSTELTEHVALGWVSDTLQEQDLEAAEFTLDMDQQDKILSCSLMEDEDIVRCFPLKSPTIRVEFHGIVFNRGEKIILNVGLFELVTIESL
jgi:hypothetical protein